MAGQKKQKKLPQFGKQPPQYRFFLNPYQDVRFTNCPQCGQKMRQRKLPLMVHIDPMYLLSLNKTCRYCPHCDLLIAHQDDIEGFLTSYFAAHQPEVVGNDYLVLGTQERVAWKRGKEQPLTMEETLESLHDFKDVVKFELVGGWG
ncbi:MAG: hypothetical protein J2P37_23645 [Ktedonobacteraceae bacterium]|nr:hypothetical protein [Ktedonobacteraceae bacterium]